MEIRQIYRETNISIIFVGVGSKRLVRTDTSASMVLPTRSGITNMINKLKEKKTDDPPPAPLIKITVVDKESKQEDNHRKTNLIPIEVIRQRLKIKRDENNIEDILNYVIA